MRLYSAYPFDLRRLKDSIQKWSTLSGLRETSDPMIGIMKHDPDRLVIDHHRDRASTARNPGLYHRIVATRSVRHFRLLRLREEFCMRMRLLTLNASQSPQFPEIVQFPSVLEVTPPSSHDLIDIAPRESYRRYYRFL